MLPSPFNSAYISSPYGPRDIGFHSGTDWGAKAGAYSGAAIRASGPGVVTFSGWNGSRPGNVKTVLYDGYGANRRVVYCHLKNLDGARVNQRVKEGDIIGYVGATGSALGDHLHAELVGGGDPMKLIFDKNRYVGGGSSAGEEDEMTPEQAAQVIAQLAAVSGKVDWLYATQIAFADAKPQYSWAQANTNTLAELAPLIKDVQYRVRGSSEEEGYETGDMLQRIRWGVDALTKRPGATVSDEQIKAIADAVAAQIGQSGATIDYGKVADSVRDRFRTDPLK